MERRVAVAKRNYCYYYYYHYHYYGCRRRTTAAAAAVAVAVAVFTAAAAAGWSLAARLLRGSPGSVLSGSRRQVVPSDRREIIVRASYQPYAAVRPVLSPSPSSGILLSPSSYRHGVPVRRQFTCCTRVLALLPPMPCRRYSVTPRPSLSPQRLILSISIRPRRCPFSK